MSERDSVIGFFDTDGKWATISEIEEHFGDDVDTPVPELIEELAEVDMVNVRRDNAGNPVTAQLSEFAVALYELPEDATPSEKLAVYQEHDKEVPEEIEAEWRQEFQERKDEFLSEE